MATVLNDDTAILATGSDTLAIGLRALLLSIPPIQRVEQVADIDELTRKLITTKPALIVIDSSLCGARTADVLRAARNLSPGTRRAILSDNMIELRELLYNSQETIIIKGTEPRRLARTFEYFLSSMVAS